jgi:hypothetical protein
MAIYTKADYTRGVTLRSRATKTPIPLDGWALELLVRASRAAPTEELLLTSEPAGGLTLDPANVGRFEINLTAAQTTALGAGDHAFAVYRVDGGKRARIMSGRLVVKEGV